ncbi:MAG: hypothetical protein Q7J01_03315 [Syntrophales bacterium]|nr:hypothetical protein [Syntrophales bacterium]
MKSEERELQERLDACVQEKNELEQKQKKIIVELEEKIRFMESRNLSLKRYSSGLQEERDELQEERDELRHRVEDLEREQKKEITQKVHKITR